MKPEERKNHEYLGDGAYIEYVGYGFWLRANHHTDEHCTDKVFIDISDIKNLIEFCERKMNNE
jgi:hypothetical protein